MLKFLGHNRRQLKAELKRNAEWLRGLLPWPFSKKKPNRIVYIVHVDRDAPQEFTRHYFKRLISDRMRGILAFFSLLLSAACLGLSSHLLAMGSRAVEFASFHGLIDSVGVKPFASFVVVVGGIQTAAYSVGCIQCCRAMSSIYRSDVKNKHGWMALYSIVLHGGLIGLMIIVFLTYVHEGLVDTLFRRGLGPAMKKYGTDESFKKVIDNMQMTSQCCGSVSYKDWWNVSWWPEKYVDSSSEMVQSKHVGGSFVTDDVPFSCCDVRHLGPCVHESMRSNYQRNAGPPSIYVVGCTTALMKSFTETVVPTIRSSTYGGLGVLVTLFVTYRYLETSLSVARAAGNGTATAVGYLLSWRYRGVTVDKPSELYALITKIGKEKADGGTKMAAVKATSRSPANAAGRTRNAEIVPYGKRWPPSMVGGAGRYPVGYNDVRRYIPTHSPFGYRYPGYPVYPGYSGYPGQPHSNYNYGYHNKNDVGTYNGHSSDEVIETTSTESSEIDEESQRNNSNVDHTLSRSSIGLRHHSNAGLFNHITSRGLHHKNESTLCGYGESRSTKSSRQSRVVSRKCRVDIDVESGVVWLEGGGSSARSPIARGESPIRLTPELVAAHLKTRRRRRRRNRAALGSGHGGQLVPRSTLDTNLGEVSSTMFTRNRVETTEQQRDIPLEPIYDLAGDLEQPSVQRHHTKHWPSIVLDMIPAASASDHDRGREDSANNFPLSLVDSDADKHVQTCSQRVQKSRERRLPHKNTAFRGRGCGRSGSDDESLTSSSVAPSRLVPCVAGWWKVQRWIDDHQHLMVPELI